MLKYFLLYELCDYLIEQILEPLYKRFSLNYFAVSWQ